MLPTTDGDPAYHHRQVSPVRFVLLAVFVLSLWAAWVFRPILWVWLAMLLIAVLSAFVLLTMTTLTVEGDGESLWVRFGPLPLFSTRIPLATIREFHVSRSKIIDGWGIHYIPGRGWTWSLWGFDCVEIEREHGTIRLGTNDADHLAQFLQSHTPPHRPDNELVDFGNPA